MLNVQNFLLSYSSREEALLQLKEQYKIDIKDYENDLVVLNYNQIESPKFNEIVDECRGLILSKDFKEVYCRSYDRFYNFGEGGSITTNFNFQESVIYSKEDGTLLNLWYHPKKDMWVFSTRKMAYSEGTTAFGLTFNTIASEALNGVDVSIALKYAKLDKNLTYIFELTTPKNRIVKPYMETCLYLTGVRNKNTGEYFNIKDHIDKFTGFNVKLPDIYYFDSHENVVKSLKELKPLDEGYVCYHEKSGTRVKIKSPAYVAVHHLRDNGNVNPKRVALLVFENEYEEYLTYFPEDIIFFKSYIEAYDILVKEIEKTYETYKNIESQKDFALSIKHLLYADVLFEMRKGGNLKECLDKYNDEKKVRILSLFS